MTSPSLSPPCRCARPAEFTGVPRGARSAPQGDPTAVIRAAIRRIADQREHTRTEAGRTLATQEQVRQAVRDQRSYLDAARAGIDAAIAAARRAAESARNDAAADARRAADGRDRGRDVGRAGLGPVCLEHGAVEHPERGHAGTARARHGGGAAGTQRHRPARRIHALCAADLSALAIVPAQCAALRSRARDGAHGQTLRRGVGQLRAAAPDFTLRVHRPALR